MMQVVSCSIGDKKKLTSYNPENNHALNDEEHHKFIIVIDIMMLLPTNRA